ncbi:MAG: RNA polymerase sigma factor [Planctomycetota bacterium]
MAPAIARTYIEMACPRQAGAWHPRKADTLKPPNQIDAAIVERIREGDSEAWAQLIARFEGRLLAYVDARARNRTAAEDVVQETFIGFLTSLPNYDARRPLESYLFSIAAYKLTDYLRRQGRRPTLPLLAGDGPSSALDPPGDARPASSIARSGERRGLEQAALTAALREQIDHWRQQGHWQKIVCCELLFVRGTANKDVARMLRITEQTVANTKHELITRLRTRIGRQNLSEDVFPELYE